MKHYFSYDANGQLIGIHVHSHAGTKLNGWGADCCLEDPDCEHHVAKHLREKILGSTAAVGFIPYNCSCSPTEQECQCTSLIVATKRVSEGVLVSKVRGAFVKGGEILPENTVLTQTPGEKFLMKMVAVGVPNGTTVRLIDRPGVALFSPSPVDLTFTDGETPEIEVTTPAQGLTGYLLAISGLTIPLQLAIRGWA